MEDRSEGYRDVLDPSHARRRRLRRAVVAGVLMLLLVVVVWRMDDEPAQPEEQAEVEPVQRQTPAFRPATIPTVDDAPEDSQDRIPGLIEGHVETVNAESVSDEAADTAERETEQVERDAPVTAATDTDDETTAAASAGGGTRVHLGGYQALHAARDQARVLAEADYPLQLFRRVRVGPFGARTEANQALQQLRAEHDLDGMLTGGPSADGRWRVQVGVFTNQDNADRLVAELEEKGFAVEQAGRLELGPYASREAAEQAVERLSDHDVDASDAELRDVR